MYEHRNDEDEFDKVAVFKENISQADNDYKHTDVGAVNDNDIIQKRQIRTILYSNE